MEPASESRDLVTGSSSNSEEDKVVDPGNGKDSAVGGDVPSFPEDWEIVHLKPSKGAPTKKLCGYLHKYSAKAPINAWKSRWFFYDDRKCHLLYYRTAQDANPLGSIEISSASFDLRVGAGEGVFEIRTPSKNFVLKVREIHDWLMWEVSGYGELSSGCCD